MAMTKYLASVTFENAQGAPETHREVIEAASHQKAASSAVRAAKRMLPGRRPTSIVILLELDRE